MNKQTIEIIKTDNGYILRFDDDSEETEYLKYQEVIQIKDEDVMEQEALKELLERVARWTGKDYQKFMSNNLVISFNGKGHKV